MKLARGSDQCQCMACLEYFLTTEAFDYHRVGSKERRRCRDRDWMDRKMGRDEGFWRIWQTPVGDP